MLENFIFSANAVFPIFLVIAFGYFLRRARFLTTSAVGEMNRLVFTFALPLLLFRNIYQAEFAALFDLKFILWILGSTIICFVLLWIFAEIFCRRQKELTGSFVQASIRANYAIVGLPLVANIMGGYDTGKAALAAAFVVTSFNVQSVIVLTAKDKDGQGTLKASHYKDMALSVIKNPSIIGIFAGVALNLLNIPLPVVLEVSVNYMAVLCTPMALLSVGASIQISELMGILKPALMGSVLKIIIVPGIFVTLSVLLGFRGEPLAVLFAIFANPTAIMSYVMAARMNGHIAITSAIILITTAFSSITLTIGVYVLRTLSLI